MCGIVGYIGNKKATPILLEGLSKLEYRGYDSAGIAVVQDNKIFVEKDKGRVRNLFENEEIKKFNANIGIAHTRWATHGAPSKINSHPHTDNSNTFVVVHNGIIENYVELREFLQNNGYNFLSETDTEVIPNLIHYFYEKDSENDEMRFLRAVKSACEKLIGSFAIEVLCKENPEVMIVVRKDSPLVIGKGDGEVYVASDIPAILNYTKDFYLLENLEFTMISKDKIRFFDQNLNEFNKNIDKIAWDAAAADKGGFEDYMLKEIFEEPTVIRETIGSRIQDGKCNFHDLEISKEYLENINQIYIVACGTAMHAGMASKPTFEKLCKIHTEVDIASEFRYRDPLIDKHTLCIFISQSGETADTIAALKLAKSKGAKTIAVANVIGSSITREAHYSIYTHAGPEIAVASTKAYTCQMTLLVLLGIYFGVLLGRVNEEQEKKLIKEILELPAKVKETVENTDVIKKLAKDLASQRDVFYIGRGIDYVTSEEASLKLKEISYIHSESYAAGELKHGTIALVEKGINVIGIMTDKDLASKTLSNLEETATRGAITTVVTTNEILEKLKTKNFDNIITVPSANTYISPIISIVPLQLLAYYVSKEKGLDVDKPRNLAKSVTVE